MHYAGKRLQEEITLVGPIPTTIVRMTQFHEFAAMVGDWTRQGDVATVPPLLAQLVTAPTSARSSRRSPPARREVAHVTSPDPKSRTGST